MQRTLSRMRTIVETVAVSGDAWVEANPLIIPRRLVVWMVFIRHWHWNVGVLQPFWYTLSFASDDSRSGQPRTAVSVRSGKPRTNASVRSGKPRTDAATGLRLRAQCCRYQVSSSLSRSYFGNCRTQRRQRLLEQSAFAVGGDFKTGASGNKPPPPP